MASPRICSYSATYSSTIRSLSNRSTATDRINDRSKDATFATAAAAPATSATRIPVTPSSMISAIEPRSKATTGVPLAIASTTLKPKGSSKSMRWSRAAAEPRNAERSSAATAPTNRTRSPSSRGATSEAK